jgi:cysteinyl-tRNA synthetase
MDDDFNTGAAIAALFGLLAEAKRADAGVAPEVLRFVRDLGRIIGLFQPGDGADTAESKAQTEQAGEQYLGQIMALVLALRQDVRARRDFVTADKIRDTLAVAGIAVKDAKDGATWSVAPAGGSDPLNAAMQVVMDLRSTARGAKDFATADRIRHALSAAGIAVADGPDGATWNVQSR